MPDPTCRDSIIKHIEPVFIGMETIVHGKTTGVDVMTVVRGGFLHITVSGVYSLEIKEDFKIILVDSRLRAKTIDAVNLVKCKVEHGTGKEIIE